MNRGLIVPAMVWLASAATISAALFAYEGFDYNAAPHLINQNGGIGWDGPWAQFDPNDGDNRVVREGLTHGALPVEGGSATTECIINDVLGHGASFRMLETPILPETTLWFSFLSSKVDGSGPNGHTFAGFSFYSGWGEEAVEALFVGKPYDSDYWGFEWAQDDLIFETSHEFDTNTVFLVGRLELKETEDSNFHLWVNPQLDSEPLEQFADATYSGMLDYSFDSVRIASGSWRGWLRGVDANVDEIRIGTTYWDVSSTSVIPEPATILTLALGMSLVLARAFRRAKI